MNERDFGHVDPDFFRHLWQDAPQAVLVYDGNGLCVYGSPGLKRIMAKPLQEILGRPWSDFLSEIHHEDWVYVQEALKKLQKGKLGDSLSVLFRLRHRGGEHRLAEATAINRLEDPSVKGFAFYIVPIVDRKLAEDMLLSERERLLTTLRSIGDAVIATDMEGRITLVNKVTEQLTEWEAWDTVGKPISEIFHIINEETGEPCDNPVTKVFQSGIVVGLANHTALISRSGRRYSIEDSAAPIRDANGDIAGAILVFRDVTQAKKNAEEILKVQKLESIGVLAGGIAHDFNNILSAILGTASLALELVPSGSKVHQLLEILTKATSRASDLTKQLLTFAKGGSPVLQAASLQGIVKESALFVMHGSQVDCQINLPEDLYSVRVDKGQIGQVVQNLTLNAVQAMNGRGTFQIEGSNVDLPADESIPLPEGSYVRLRFRDQGPGIPKENLARIFEPYFTTKDWGNGLGLSVVYSVVKNHGGWIRAESSVGVGTTFSIYLPAHHDPEPRQEGSSTVQVVTNHGKVLIMDDEEQSRKVVADIIRYLGFECVESADGKNALEVAASDPGFVLAIVDLTVPGGLGGREIVARLKELSPGVRVIVSSGYSNDATLAHYRDFGFDGCLAKPFTTKDLMHCVQKVLTEGSDE